MEYHNEPTNSSLQRKHEFCCDGSNPDDIVISGMSGRFPMTDNIQEFSDALYNKTDLLQPCDRWEKGLLGISGHYGGLNGASKFDAEFFNTPNCIARSIEPEQRLLLEVCYEAICDAGYDPRTLRGQQIGVYCASSTSDGREIFMRGANYDNYTGVGYLRCLRANRCSYVFDFIGPSITMDTACSSSAAAFGVALQDLRDGRCSAAIVSGCQVVLSPEVNSGYAKCGILSADGKSYPMDDNACGMIRTDASAALFLQKACEAKRIYAKVESFLLLSSGYTPEGVYVPYEPAHIRLFKKTFENCNVSPLEIDYVEAHGTGTHVGDPIELNAVAKFYCKGRRKPLLVGTVKSNIGHTEAAAGICGIVKSILAFETGYVAPNLYFDTPNRNCPSLLNGTLKVVTEPEPLTSQYIGVNCFGFGGCNSHLILKKNALEYQEKQKDCGIPHLALCSATTEEGVQFALHALTKSSFLPREFFSLLHNIAYSVPLYKPYRGYTLLNEETVFEIQKCSQAKREVWYIVTGMGCQWPGMGLNMMQIDVFAKSMRKSAKVLEQFGIDLLELIRSDKDYLLQNRKITPAFVTICSIQIAIVDVLRELEIHPDGIVGHSTGELVCAYADGCCTAEQTILSAYHRGQVVESGNLADGEMAAVGLTWDEAKKLCPEDVYPACHNAEDSVTISGLTKPLQKFVSQLKKENVFARVVNAYGYGFHCPLVRPAAAALKSALDKIITDPKPKTKRWLSTSYAPEDWDLPEANLPDPAYFVHNLMSNVHFAEALKYIPSDAITIEIGPHFLLQAILKRVIGSNGAYLGMMKRNENNINFLLSSIGKMYNLGLNPKIENIYPPVKYPVPRGTPRISDLIKWNHSYSWPVPKYVKTEGASTTITLKLSEGDKYLLDHCIEGRSLFPATGYIFLAWTAFSKLHNRNMDEFPIIVENFKILRATIMTSSDVKDFNISFLSVGGEFEIVEGGTVVSTGKISTSQEIAFSCEVPCSPNVDSSDMVSGSEMYNELRIQGYEYGPAFQGLVEAHIDGTTGSIKWNNEWISYLDAHLLFFGLLQKSHEFYLPTGALSFKIDPTKLLKFANELEQRKLKGMPVMYDSYIKCCCSPGVEIRELSLEPAPHRHQTENLPILEEYHFIPYNESSALLDDHKQICLEYISICNDFVKDITLAVMAKDKSEVQNKLSGDLPARIENWKNNYISDDHRLLDLLTEVSRFDSSEMLLNNSIKIFEKYLRQINDDLLYKALFKERPLRNILDVIVESSTGKLNIVELSGGSYQLLPDVSDMIKNFCHTKSNSLLLHTDPDTLQEKLFSERSIEVRKLDNFKSDQTYNVIIDSYLFGDKNSLDKRMKYWKTLGHNGSFVILYHRDMVAPAEAFLCSLCDKSVNTVARHIVEKHVSEENWTILAKKDDSMGSTLYLLRLDTDNVPKTNSIVHVQDHYFKEWVNELKKSMVDASDNEDAIIWVIAQDSASTGVVGLANCLRQEPSGDKIRCIFTPKEGNSVVPPFGFNEKFYYDVLKKKLFMNVCRNGVWGSFKHISIPAGPHVKVVDHSVLTSMKYGDLSSFRWVESPLKYKTKLNEDLETFIHICYSSLNFRDVMLATGKLNSGFAAGVLGYGLSSLGIEFSGVTSEGKRVMGSVSSQAVATALKERTALILDVPDHWTLEEAATVPVVYLTAYYALMIRGKLMRGESILIHSGTGGVGIAVIRICLNLDCKVFATVGTEQKKRYLRSLFPQIKEENIGCSHDTTFEDLVRRKTKGIGVDIVCNSLAEEKLHAGVRCLAENGRFIEIGKYDLSQNHNLGMKVFLKNVTFSGVFLDKLYEDDPKVIKECNIALKLCNEGIRAGVVQPLDRTVFDRNDVEGAFRYMASGRHVGKVIVKIQDEPPIGSIPPLLKQPAIAYSYFYAYKSYIVIGGLGGFGIELTKWMIHRGARNIVLTSRFGARTAYHRLCLKRWKDMGINVIVCVLNAAEKKEARQLLKDASSIAPVAGIFNSAVVLKDAFMENQTVENFIESCLPKATATKNLDELTRELGPQLDYFVCFSSISCGKGNAGQSNYGYANSSMERICEKRKRDGLHGLSIQWGIIGEVGLVHRHMGEDAMIAGVVAQKIKSCLTTLEQFLLQDHPVVCSYVNADMSKRKKSSEDNFVSQIAKVFGYSDPSELSMQRTLREIGMDSMIGVEILQVLESNYDITISIHELQNMKVGDIQAIIDSKANTSPVKQEKGPISVNLSIPETLFANTNVIPLKKLSSGNPVFIIHHSKVHLEKLCGLIELIQAPVYGVCCTKTTSAENAGALVMEYFQHISKIENNKLSLIGLASGASLSFELAMTFQKHKNVAEIKSLTILDGTLNLVSLLSGEGMQSPSNKRESEILCQFLSQFSNDDLSELKSDLEAKPDLESRMKMIEAICSSCVESPKNTEITEAINLYFKVENLISCFSPKNKFPGDINLMESTTKLLPNDVKVVKSDVSKICQGKIFIERIPGGNDFLLDQESYTKVAELLNKIL